MVSTPVSVDRPIRAGGAVTWRTICLVPAIDPIIMYLPAEIDYRETMQFAFAENGWK
jgi:hypothetical protein